MSLSREISHRWLIRVTEQLLITVCAEMVVPGHPQVSAEELLPVWYKHGNRISIGHDWPGLVLPLFGDATELTLLVKVLTS